MCLSLTHSQHACSAPAKPQCARQARLRVQALDPNYSFSEVAKPYALELLDLQVPLHPLPRASATSNVYCGSSFAPGTWALHPGDIESGHRRAFECSFAFQSDPHCFEWRRSPTSVFTWSCVPANIILVHVLARSSVRSSPGNEDKLHMRLL